jgi:hypothetical protein
MTTFSLTLPLTDIFQILDGLNKRAESWEYTARYLSGNMGTESEFRLPEECSCTNEARKIAQHFRDIGETIRTQI